MQAAAVLPVLAGLAAAPLAWADSDKDTDKPAPPHPRLLLANEVLNGTLSAAGTSYQDAAGNTYIEGATYTGTATGTITGRFRADLSVFTPAGSSSSRFWGSLVISDDAKPSNVVFGAVAGDQASATTGDSDTGRFTVDGGLGSYLNAHGTGSMQGVSTAALNAGGSITWTLNSAPGQGPHPCRGKGQSD
jgi:hypothetical protein